VITRPLALVLLAACLLLASCATAPSRHSVPESEARFSRGAFDRLDLMLAQGERRWSVPGAALAIARDGRLVYQHAGGWADLAAHPPVRMEPDTVFDVASLTKPVTAMAVLTLVCEGALGLGDPVIGGATVEQLLLHTGGLPEHADWREVERARAGRRPAVALAEMLERRGLLDPPGEAYRYSNLGYILLADLVEQTAGLPFADFLDRRVTGRLLMPRTSFAPRVMAGTALPFPVTSIARTSLDVDPGKPFDPFAAYLRAVPGGAAAGHSGLFSTAGELAFLAQALVHPATRDALGLGCVATAMLDHPRLIRRRDGGEPVWRTLGFEAGPEHPRGAVLRHTGYTGCLLWIDRESGVTLALLTNATHGADSNWDAMAREITRIVREATRRT
jgi:CubicO group peptidase (beta-lactamase class C family)